VDTAAIADDSSSYTVSQEPPPDRFMLQRQLPVDYPPDPGRLAITDGYSKKGGFMIYITSNEIWENCYDNSQG